MTKQEIYNADDAADWLRNRADHYQATDYNDSVLLIRELRNAADELDGAGEDE